MAWPIDSGNAEDRWNNIGTGDIPTVMAALCRAVNERRECRGLTAHEFHYTDALDVTMPYPEAEDFDCRMHGACWNDVLGDLYTLVRSGSWYTDASFVTPYTGDDLWDTAGGSLPAWNLSRGVLWAPNIARLRRALDLELYAGGTAGLADQAGLTTTLNSGSTWKPTTPGGTWNPPNTGFLGVGIGWANLAASGTNDYRLYETAGSVTVTGRLGLVKARLNGSMTIHTEIQWGSTVLGYSDFVSGSSPLLDFTGTASFDMYYVGSAPGYSTGLTTGALSNTFSIFQDLTAYLTDQA